PALSPYQSSLYLVHIPRLLSISFFFFYFYGAHRHLHSFPTRRSSDLSISIDKVRSDGYDEIPKYGFTPVMVPGQPGAWAELSRRFGRLPFKDLMVPAIQYAEEGYPISPVLAKLWNRAAVKFKDTF